MQDRRPVRDLEFSYEYVCLLHEALEEARQTIQEELVQATAARAERRRFSSSSTPARRPSAAVPAS